MQKSMQLSSHTTEHTHNQRGRSSEGILTKLKDQVSISIIPSTKVLLQPTSIFYAILTRRTCVKGYVEVGL